MSVKPRTPVEWPRMKVRGRRRRALASKRVDHVVVIPYARVTVREFGAVTFEALAAPELGAVRIERKWTTDGFGRPVRRSL